MGNTAVTKGEKAEYTVRKGCQRKGKQLFTYNVPFKTMDKTSILAAIAVICIAAEILTG